MSEFTVYGLEKLEDRVLLAVDVSLNRGTLTIESDGADDSVHIFEFYDYIIVAVDEDSDGVFDFYTYHESADVRRINVNMGGGDDTVLISNLQDDATLSVDLGTGSDTFFTSYEGYFYDFDTLTALSNYYASEYVFGPGYGYFAYGNVELRDVKVSGGDGDDVMAVLDAEIDRNVTIIGGGGDDVGYVASADADLVIGGNVKMDLGSGDDIGVVAATGGYAAYVDGSITILGGTGYDIVALGAVGGEDLNVDGNVKIDMGKDNDGSYTLIVARDGSDVTFDGKIDFRGSDGDDFVYIYSYDDDIDFNGRVTLDGRGGTNELDVYEVLGEVEFNGGLTLKKFDLV